MNLDVIYNEDCLTGLAKLPDNCIDLTVTSPPYDNLRKYNGYTFDFEGIAQQLYRVTKQGGVVVWVVGDATVNGSETGTSFRQALYFKDVCGFNLHDTMIWNKESFNAVGALQTRYAPVFEYMFILSKGPVFRFNPIKDRKNKHSGTAFHGTLQDNGGGIMRKVSNKGKLVADWGQRFNIWSIPPHRCRIVAHPAPFPEQIAHDHILSWSNEGDTVLDPFMGSGTTAKVAMQLNRHYLGYEISAEYCRIAEQRLANHKSRLLLAASA